MKHPATWVFIYELYELRRNMLNRIMKTKEVCKAVGLSRTTIWRLENEGNFPKRRKITPAKIGWIESEINEWIGTRPIAENLFENNCKNISQKNCGNPRTLEDA